MHNSKQKVEPDETLELSMKWESAFRELMDTIFFEGYSLMLLQENPLQYQQEYFYFITLYDSPIQDEYV